MLLVFLVGGGGGGGVEGGFWGGKVGVEQRELSQATTSLHKRVGV